MTVALRQSAFVGRVAELAQLDDALRCRAQRPGLVIAGEAGIGKTRLLHEFERQAGAQGALVIWGGCLESGADRLPFAPFVEALDRMHESCGDEAGLFDRPELAALVPSLGPTPTIAPERIRLFEAVRAVLERVPDPTVLVLEDIHWADRSSLELLSYVVRRLRHGHTLVAATLRSDEVVGGHPAAPIVGELVRTERAYRLDLSPLTSEQVGQIVRDVTPELARDAVELITRRSEGNPFFAEALASASPADDAALPPTLRELLLLRIDQVDGPARSVLELVAIAGRPVSVGLLAAAWDGGHAELDAGIAEAIDRGLLREGRDSGLLFLRHALVAEALEARIPPGERARLHEVLGVIISEFPELGAPDAAGRAGELARHMLAAGRLREALAASVRAAEAAESVPARTEALAHYERSLELWPGVSDAPAVAGFDHPTLLCRAARAADLSGAGPRAVELETRAAAEAEADGDRTAAGEHYTALSRYCSFAEQFQAIDAAARRALELVPPDPPSRERSLALRSLVLVQTSRGEHLAGTIELCGEAVSHAAAVSGVDAECLARSLLGSALWTLGHDETAFAEHDRSAFLATTSADPSLVKIALANRLMAFGESASDPAGAWSAIAHARAAYERMDIGGEERTLQNAEVRMLYMSGAWDEVERRTTAWLASEHDATDDDAFFLRRGEVEIHRGLVDEGEADLRAALGVLSACDPEGVIPYVVAVHAVLAEASLVRARSDAALHSVEHALEVLKGKDYVVLWARLSALGLRCAADLAETARRHRDPDAARRARQAGEGHRRRIESALAETLVEGMAAGPRVRAAAAWGLAEASRLDGTSDPSLWSDAASRLEAWCYPELVPYARFRLAEALLASGRDREAATAALRAGFGRASELGMRPLIGDIAALARRARIPVAAVEPKPVSAQYGLSSREREVLAMLVDGRTNREIGERLFISEKTASVHVTHILDKLGVNSRGAAAALVSREGNGRKLNPEA